MSHVGRLLVDLCEAIASRLSLPLSDDSLLESLSDWIMNEAPHDMVQSHDVEGLSALYESYRAAENDAANPGDGL